jgi:hypothetical protein
MMVAAGSTSPWCTRAITEQQKIAMPHRSWLIRFIGLLTWAMLTAGALVFLLRWKRQAKTEKTNHPE